MNSGVNYVVGGQLDRGQGIIGSVHRIGVGWWPLLKRCYTRKDIVYIKHKKNQPMNYTKHIEIHPGKKTQMLW